MKKSILRNGGWSIIPVALICLTITLYALLNNANIMDIIGVPVYFLIFGIPALIQIRMNIKESQVNFNEQKSRSIT
jgi:hypothetical protein